MISFLIGIAAVLITFYLAFLYARAAVGLLACALAVLWVLAFVYLLFAGGRILGGIRIPIATAEQGGEVSVFLDVENRRRFPCVRIRYRLCCRNRLGNKALRRWYSGCPIPRGKHSYCAAVRLSAAGSYTVTLEKLRVYDLTGLFYRNLRVGKSAGVQVLPDAEVVSLRITEGLRNFYGDADVYDDFRPGDDSSEIFDVREFRAGDKIQSIHWKLSAKSDDLIVRQDSQPHACPVVLILDGDGMGARGAETFLSVAASLIFSMMDRACAHYVSWYSGSRQDIVRARVDDEEGYYLALCSYMEDCVSQGKTRGQAEERYREKYRGDHPMHVLLLRGDLTLWLDGDKKASFDAKDWKRALERLELVL